MHAYLDEILKHKREEVSALLNAFEKDPHHPLRTVKSKSDRRFSTALKQTGLSVIAEVKRCSPSVGEIGEIADPVGLALEYAKGGAAAISVLTNAKGFGGSLSDLKEVSIGIPSATTLRKDFIIHPMQLAEAALAGASAALLIAGLIGKKLNKFIDAAAFFGIEALVEVHNFDELKLAIDSGAEIIGVNNRNLQSFEADVKLACRLRSHIPNHLIAVAESGIHTAEQARQMREIGYDAILVGEALVRARDPALLIQQMRGAL